MDNFNTFNMYVQNITCDYCGREHAYSECLVDNWSYPYFEQTNFVDDFSKPPITPTSTLTTLNGVINLTLQSSILKKVSLNSKNL